MRKAICPGSFDPVTNGHVDIIERSCKLFDRVTVLVLQNPDKNCVFTAEERVELLRVALRHIPNVDVDCFDGLLAEYARNVGACALVKGLRAVTDFEYEFQMALTNKKLNNELETLFMNTDETFMYLSSSVVRQVARLGGDISGFVPANVHDAILKKLKG